MELRQVNKPYYTDQSIVYRCQDHVTLTRSRTGKWYACFSCEVEADSLPLTRMPAHTTVEARSARQQGWYANSTGPLYGRS